MPSERKTHPTARRMSITDAGAVVLIRLRTDLIELVLLQNLLYLWGRGRGELGDICKPETVLDRADLFDGIFKAVLTKLLVLNVLKFVVHLIELLACHGLFPRGKDDRVFPCGMIAIHEDERLQRLRQCFSGTRA